MHISTSRCDRSKIPTATPSFSTTAIPMELIGILTHVSGSGKSKMAVYKLVLSTKCSEDWDPLVSYKSSTSPTATSSALSRYFVTPSAAVRDLGIHLDSEMSMSSHVRKTVSTCFAVLRQLRSIRRSVSRPVVQSLVMSLVLRRLDYGNATLAGIPQHLLRRLQSVMNAAARLINSSSRFDHITPLLRQLHWLKAK